MASHALASPSPSRLKLKIPQDVHIYLFPLPDGSTKVILKLTQRWVKNNKDPENHVYAVLPSRPARVPS